MCGLVVRNIVRDQAYLTQPIICQDGIDGGLDVLILRGIIEISVEDFYDITFDGFQLLLEEDGKVDLAIDSCSSVSWQRK